MERISLIALLLLPIALSGCLQRLVNFDPPPYVPIESTALPPAVERAFATAYPDTPIGQVESLTWPPTGDEHYRLTFKNDRGTMQVRYTHRGKTLGKPTLLNQDLHRQQTDDRVESQEE
jgi:hypothetical protein